MTLVPSLESQQRAVAATSRRRIAADFADGALFVLTLGVGWLIWSVHLAGKGQSPGKALFRMQILKTDGAMPSRSLVLLRELLFKRVVGLATGELSTLVAALQLAWDRRPWWDRICSSTVVVPM